MYGWMDRQKRIEWNELVDCDPGKVCEADEVTGIMVRNGPRTEQHEIDGGAIR